MWPVDWGKLIGVVTVVASVAGGLTWLYSAVKAQGEAEANAEHWEAAYAKMRDETGAAIAEVQAQHARQNLARSQREKDIERARYDDAKAIAEMRQLLEDAQNAPKLKDCLDVPATSDMVDRLRKLSDSVSNVGY